MYVKSVDSSWRARARSAMRFALKAFAVYVAFQVGYQGWQNLVLWTNVRSLGAEVNSLGRDGFRAHLREVAYSHGMTLHDDDIRISLDERETAVVIDVAVRWHLNLIVTHLKGTRTIHGLTARWPDSQW